jgi:hypothetical protein
VLESKFQKEDWVIVFLNRRIDAFFCVFSKISERKSSNQVATTRQHQNVHPLDWDFNTVFRTRDFVAGGWLS